MKTLFLKDSSNRRKQFALTTRICEDNRKKIVIKEACFQEGITHLKRIAESQNLFSKYYKNVMICKAWIKDELLFSEFIEGIPLSDLYIKLIQENDKDKLIELINYHIELSLGKNNICKFKETDDFIKLFGNTDYFSGKPALIFTFFDPLPENIILKNGKLANPCFIDYEWFFDFPIPVSLLKFRIIRQLSMLSGLDNIIPINERMRIFKCDIPFDKGIELFNKFSDFVFKENDIDFMFINKSFEKNIHNYPAVINQNSLYSTLYIDTGNGYSENEKLSFSFTGNEAEISCQIPTNTVALRLDPIEGSGCVISNFEILSYSGIIKYEPSNGYIDNIGNMVFTNTDPCIIIYGASYSLKIKFKILILSEFSHYKVFDNYVFITHERDGLVNERNTLMYERNVLEAERNGLITERDNLVINRDELITERDVLVTERNSFQTEHNELITERNRLVAEQNILEAKYPELNTQYISLYFDTGNNFNEIEKISFSYIGKEAEISCSVPEGTCNIRMDPVEGYGCIINELEILSSNGIVKYESINGFANNNGDIIFTNADPQIIFQNTASWLKIKFKITLLSEYLYYNLLNDYIVKNKNNIELAFERDRLINERNTLTYERDILEAERNGLITERDNLVRNRDELVSERNGLVAERDGLVTERDGLVTEMTSLQTKHNNLILERDNLIINNDELVAKRDGLEIERNILITERDDLIRNIDELIAERDELEEKRICLITDRDNLINNYNELSIERDNLLFDKNELILTRDNLVIERDNLIFTRNNLATNCPESFSHTCNIFFDTGNGYTENEKLVKYYFGNEVNISFIVPENTISIRVDPIEGYGCIVSKMEIISDNNNIIFKPINGLLKENEEMVFSNTDPQILLLGVALKINIKYHILVFKLFDDSIGIGQERDKLSAELTNLTNEQNKLKSSKSWRLTEPLRKIGAFIRRHKTLYKFVKFLLSIKRIGIVKSLKMNSYNKKQKKYLLQELNMSSQQTEYQENMDFSGYEPKVKAIAFYLPQFHRIPENDKWWGKGFTEWTNTRKTKPRFAGHYQPREPHKDIGYYDLTNIETLKKQALLAKQHGIYGFCFYYYWFSGIRLLEKPLDLLLEHQEIDINFCLCWANENWTRVWDGLDKEVLMQQDYTNDDPYNFIIDIKKYINDKRYIKIKGKPVILIYNPGRIPNVKNVLISWRKYAIESGIGEISIFVCRTFGNTPYNLNIADVVDGEVEFPPNGLTNFQPNIIYLNGKTANLFNYKEIVNYIINLIKNNNIKVDLLPIYRTCLLEWDNAARKEDGWTTFSNFSLELFYDWVNSIINEAQTKYLKEDSFIFINAWNEWAEGTYLEPDKKHGYANINTLSKAIFGFKYNSNNINHIKQLKYNKNIIFIGHDAYQNGAQVLALNIIRQLKDIFKYNVFLLLKNDGPLLDSYKEVTVETVCINSSDENNIIEWIKSSNANTAICNTVVTGDVLKILSKCGISCISLIHEMENIIRYYSCVNNLKNIVQDAIKIVFASDYVKKSNEKILTIPDNKSVIYPQGLFNINPYLKEQKKSRELICIKHDIPPNSKIVLGVGYGEHRKGLDLFAQCMLKVCKQHEVYFLWVGNVENNIATEVDCILNESEFKNYLIMTRKWEEDFMAYYSAADIYLLTSREDPFPSVIIEAMHSYLPVIAFENGGGYVDIINEKTGCLVPMENTDIMAEQILILLKDEKLLLKMGNYAHEYVKENFNFLSYIYFLLNLLGKQYKKISVIIPNYNYAKYLNERIDSILSQTYPIFEIIILDDCSTDESMQIINEYERKFPLLIKVIKNEINSGCVFKQWSKGIQLAKGDYIWIAEADDLSEAAFLENIMDKIMLDDSIVMGYTQSRIIDENGNNIGNDYLFYTKEIDNIWENDYISDGKEEIEKRLSIKNTIPNVSSVIFKNINLSDKINILENYGVAGDWRFYIDLLKDGGKIAFISNSLNIHRRHTNSVTKTLNAKKHYDEICDVQEYIFSITNKVDYFYKAKEYRKVVKDYLKIDNENE